VAEREMWSEILGEQGEWLRGNGEATVGCYGLMGFLR